MSLQAAIVCSDIISNLEDELQKELTTEVGQNYEYIEMSSEIWSRLPHELLLVVLARLPTLIIVAISKQWKYLLAPSISPSLGISCSFPAFLCWSTPRKSTAHNGHSGLYLLGSVSGFRMKKLLLDFLPSERLTMVISSKSVICCCSFGVDGIPTSFYICNPVIGSWIKLPPPTQPTKWNFIAMDFDTSTRRCILIKGTNNTISEGERRGENNIMMEVYDSHTNQWNPLELIQNPVTNFPNGEGIYSRGRFYWISHTHCIRRGVGSYFIDDIAVFDVATRCWHTVKLPYYEFSCNMHLTGHDGRVFLVYRRSLHLWKLNEEEDNEEERWTEWRVFPGNLLEATREFKCKSYNDMRVSGYEFPRVVVNNCGWIMVHLHRDKLVVLDGEGRVMKCIGGQLLRIFEQQDEARSQAYELNNLCWP